MYERKLERTIMTEELKNHQIADALESADWSDVRIGNKAILKAAIEELNTRASVAEQDNLIRLC